MVKKSFLGMSPKKFVKEYWQKKPLLIRQAFPDVQHMLNKQQLISMSLSPDIESRLVEHKKNKWYLTHGPFAKSSFSKLTGKWTLLVQGVNYFLTAGQILLQHFNFIPYARLDDLMVSYAVDGGGVGPHFDSYDVFLLQGQGQRLWKISNQKDRDLLPNAPLRILKKFKSELEWILEPGDMLYLPPNYAHHGIAIGECMTYSIGFRAPAYQELLLQFLDYLQNKTELIGIYNDINLKPSLNPASLPDAMINKVYAAFKKIQFNKKNIAEFLGDYLTLPKANLFFSQQSHPLSKIIFLRQAKSKGIVLDLKTLMLYHNDTLFMNGNSYFMTPKIKNFFRILANEHKAKLPLNFDKHWQNNLYEWYQEGYLHIKQRG